MTLGGRAADDIKEVKWFKITGPNSVYVPTIMPAHKELFECLLLHLMWCNSQPESKEKQNAPSVQTESSAKV
jgi:hypothetical protein